MSKLPDKLLFTICHEFMGGREKINIVQYIFHPKEVERLQLQSEEIRRGSDLFYQKKKKKNKKRKIHLTNVIWKNRPFLKQFLISFPKVIIINGQPQR
jgi:hypothetical protein